MLGLRRDILSAPTFEPRAQLEGADLPADFRLPPLDVVRAEAESLKNMRLTGLEPIRAVYVTTNGVPGPQTRTEDLPEPLAYNSSLPNLFKFAYFTRVQDVPPELLEDVCFVLEMFVRVLTESTEQQLRQFGHYLPHQKAEDAQYFILCIHLMNPKIDRPEAALPQLRAAVEEQTKRMEHVKMQGAAWMHNPSLFGLLGDALTLTGQFTEETKTILEHVLQGVEESPVAKTYDFKSTALRARINLSLVLKELGAEPEKQKEHTDWVAKFLQKNPKLVYRSDLKMYIMHPNLPTHPILNAMGPEWVAKLEDPTISTPTTMKMDERQSKHCRQCSLGEPQKTLFRCSGCKHIFYCSRECQRANWPLHKELCREMATSKARAEELKEMDPRSGQRALDWIKWREGTHTANIHCLVHALALQKDPSRGRTHIIIRQVEYTPHASRDLRHKFRVARCGVFRIDDVLGDIETMLRLDKGEGKEYITSLIDELDSTKRRDKAIPILDLTFGKNIETWLSSAAATLDQLRLLPYDPDWRKSMNLGEPPASMVLRSGAKDDEYVL